MALEATHIRFALDLQDKYNIRDFKKYISGAIYPDSRYITGLNRDLTHNDKFLKSDWPQNDFELGWHIHCVVDRIQYLKTLELFPEMAIKKEEPGWWVISSAIKNIQDMQDVQLFDVQKYLNLLDYVTNPNNEDIKKVRQYNQIMQNMYRDKKQTTSQDCYNTWLSLGINEELAQQVLDKTNEFLENDSIVERIGKIYNETLSSAKDVLK